MFFCHQQIFLNHEHRIIKTHINSTSIQSMEINYELNHLIINFDFNLKIALKFLAQAPIKLIRFLYSYHTLAKNFYFLNL